MVRYITHLPKSVLHSCLPLHISRKFLYCIILCVPSCQLLLGPSDFLLRGSFRFMTCLGIRVPGVLSTYPYHTSCALYFFYYRMRYLHNFLVRSFVTLPNPDLSVVLRQKSISVASNIRFVLFNWSYFTAVCVYTFYRDLLLPLFVSILE